MAILFNPIPTIYCRKYYKYIKSLGLYPSSSIHEYEEIIKSRTLKRTIAR